MSDSLNEAEVQAQRDRYRVLRDDLPASRTTQADVAVGRYLASVRVSSLRISALETNERIDRLEREAAALRAELDHLDLVVDLTENETAFVEVAAAWAVEHGIELASWLEVGVPYEVLCVAEVSGAG